MKNKILVLTIAVLINAMNVTAQTSRTFTDSRDNKMYKKVNIGTQSWMAENLNTSTFRNGDPIAEVKTEAEWKAAGESKRPAWCSYYSNPNDIKKYGKLYNSFAVMDKRGLAPQGWHIPDKREWEALTYYLGGDKVASAKMKSTTGWVKNGNNSSGFTGLATPTRNSYGFFSDGDPLTADWWSTDEGDSQGGNYYEGLMLNDAGDKMGIAYDEEDGVPVRCISDMTVEDTKAIADYEKSLANPKTAKDYNARGILKSGKGDFAGAVADFNKAIVLDPKYADAYYNRASAKAAQQDLPGAMTDLNKSIEINPKNSDAYIKRATVKVVQQDLKGAMADLNKAITITPDDAEAYRNRGRIKAAQQDLQGAITDFGKAIEFGTDNNEVYYLRGIIKYQLQDFKAALADFDEAVAGIELITNFSALFKDKTKATADDTKATVLNSWVAEVYYNRGLTKHELQDYKGAVTDYDKAIESNPAYAEAFYARGFAKTDLQDFPGAIKDFNKTILINPQYTPAYYYRGLAKAGLKDFAQSIADYSKTIELDATYADAYYNRALAKIETKDYPGSIADLTKTIEISPTSPEPYYYRASLKYTLKDYAGSIADYTKNIEIDPKNGTAYYNRGIAKINAGQKDGGCSDFKKAGELGIADAAETIKKYCN